MSSPSASSQPSAARRKFRANAEPASSVYRHGRFGIPAVEKCQVCGEPFNQPLNGRPRQICRKTRCESARRRQWREQCREPEPSRWSDPDFEEAKDLWGHRCASCRFQPKAHDFYPNRYLELVPCCWMCADWQPTPKAREWFARCSPGAPLPRVPA